MKNKKDFKNGLKRIAISISLAFIGPVLFVLGSNPQLSYNLQIMLRVFGGIVMLSCVYIGYVGIQKLLSYFFDKSNE